VEGLPGQADHTPNLYNHFSHEFQGRGRIQRHVLPIPSSNKRDEGSGAATEGWYYHSRQSRAVQTLVKILSDPEGMGKEKRGRRGEWGLQEIRKEKTTLRKGGKGYKSEGRFISRTPTTGDVIMLKLKFFALAFFAAIAHAAVLGQFSRPVVVR